MSDFKFQCPSCGQKIKVDAAASGRKINCPDCQSELLVPAATKTPGQLPAATALSGKPAAKAASSKPAPITPPKPGAGLAPKLTIAKPGAAAPPKPKPATESAPAKPRPPQPREAAPVVTPKVATEQAVTVKPPAEAPVPVPVQPATPTNQKPDAVTPAAPSPEEGAPSPSTRVQIAKLTPVLKRDIIRSARRRIADESHWMPRISPEREYAYAAKEVEGKTVPVEVTSPEATRFSVLGALLLEFHIRKVTRTASGRQELLDQELLDAIRQVAGDEAGEQETAPGAVLEQGKQVPTISHEQSLQVLDVLEEKYAREMKDSGVAAQAITENLHMVDLTRKLERKKPVTITELCAALANELKEIQDRLAALERPPGKGSKD